MEKFLGFWVILLPIIGLLSLLNDNLFAPKRRSRRFNNEIVKKSTMKQLENYDKMDRVERKDGQTKIVIDCNSKIEIEYKGVKKTLILNEEKDKIQKQLLSKEELRHKKSILIWQVKNIYNVKSYEDIVPRLLHFHREGDYESIVGLLDALNNLHVDTGEIIDEHPQFLEFFSQINLKNYKNTQMG